MGGDLVEEQDRAAAGALGDEIGMGEDEADQQRLLLAGRAERRRLALAEMGDDEIGAVRAGEGAAGRGVAGAAGGEARGQVRLVAASSSERPARANGPSGAAASRSASAATVARARRGDRRAMLGHPRLERGEPGLVARRLLGEQLVAGAHRRIVAGRVHGVAGMKRQDEPVEEAAAARRGLGEQRSIAGVSQSTDSHSDSELAAAGAPLIRTWRRSGAAGVGAGADLDLAEPRRHGEAAGAAAPRHFAKRGAAQARARARAATPPRARWSCPRHSRR